MRKGLWILLGVMFLSNPILICAQADTASEKNAQIIKLTDHVLKISGEEIIKKNIRDLSVQLTDKKVPQAVIDEIIRKVETKQSDEIAVKVFDQYFTKEDAQAINKFFESPAGKKYSQMMPHWTAEYLKQLSGLSSKIYQKMFDQLKDKGYEFDDLRKEYIRYPQYSDVMLPKTESSAEVKKE